MLCAMRADILVKILLATSLFAPLSASTRSLGSQSRTKRCTERSSMVTMSSNTNMRLRISSARGSLYSARRSKMFFSLERSRLFITSATKSTPPTFTLLAVIRLENFFSISASMIFTAVGEALSILAIFSITRTCRSSSSSSITAADFSAST